MGHQFVIAARLNIDLRNLHDVPTALVVALLGREGDAIETLSYNGIEKSKEPLLAHVIKGSHAR